MPDDIGQHGGVTMSYNLHERIRSGSIVTIVNRFGQKSTGRAVMRGPAGWVLNMGGEHGTPAIANEPNVVAVEAPRAERKGRKHAIRT